MLRSRFICAVLLAAVAFALLFPVWTVAYPPLLDYPNHLARSFVLTHLHDPAYNFDRFYQAGWGPYPYLAMDVLLIAFQHIVPVQIAGKLFLSLCLLAVPAAYWFFLRQTNPGSDELAFWALLVTCDEFFLESFLAFQLSIAACLLFLGLWTRWKDRLNPLRWLLLLSAITLVYFSHLIGFILAGFIVATICVLEKRVRLLLMSGLLFLPGMVLLVVSGLGVHNGRELHFRSFPEKFSELVRTLFGGFSDRLTTITLWTAVVCLLAAWLWNRELHWNRKWLVATVSLFGLYLALPYSFGETFDIDVRVLPLFFLVLFASAGIGKRRARIVGAVALILFAARMATIDRTFRGEQPELLAISRGVSLIRPGAMVLPIVEPHQEDDPNRWPYEHFSAWTVIERGAFSPYLFDLPGQTPMRISYDVYSPDAFWDSAYEDGDVDWESVQENYDYVWAYNVERFSPNLDRIGKRIYASGAFQLYEVSNQGSRHPSR